MSIPLTWSGRGEMLGMVVVLIMVGTVLGKVVEWKDKTIQVRVPYYSVLTVEVPCTVLNVAHLDLVKSAFSKKVKVNSVHIAVTDRPTSVGITCEEEGIVRSYNLFVVPDKRGGTTYLKIVDQELEKKLILAKARIRGEKNDSSVLEEAKVLMRAMLTGKTLFGYELLKGKRTYKAGSFELREIMVWSGRLIGIVYRVKNLSPMQVRVHPSMFAGKGTVLVWLEDADKLYMRPGEERMLAVVVVGKVVKSEGNSEGVLPYREK